MKYVITFLLLCITTLGYTQEIDNSGMVIVEFNAPFSGTTCTYLDDLDVDNILRVDIGKTAGAQATHKIVVIPTLIIFVDGEEVERFQANIMMQLEVTKSEVQEAIDDITMSSF